MVKALRVTKSESVITDLTYNNNNDHEHWSKPYPIRVTITHDVESDWAIKMQRHATFNTYPDIAAIMEYVKSIPIDQIEHNGAIHIYLSEIYDEHKAILEKHGAVVEVLENV